MLKPLGLKGSHCFFLINVKSNLKKNLKIVFINKLFELGIQVYGFHFKYFTSHSLHLHPRFNIIFSHYISSFRIIILVKRRGK